MKKSDLTAMVLKLGHDNELSQLNTILTSAEVGSVKDFVQGSCRTGEGPAVFRFVLGGLGWGEVNSIVEKVRLGVVNKVVEEIMKNPCVPNKNAAKFLDSLFGELEQFTDSSISQLVEVCMEELDGKEEDDKTGLRWLPLLGRLLSVVEVRDIFVPHDEDVGQTGVEYKENLVRDVCNMPWDQDRVTSICTMFKEVKLSEKQQGEVFDKLCSSLVKLPAQSIPPLVHQMLYLAKDSTILSHKLIATVNEFFSSKLSLEDRQDKTNMDIESLDMISEDNTVEELQQAEGTVVFHLTQAARLGHTVAKEVMKLVKAGSHAPELVLSPFSLFLALALTSVKQWREQLLDSLRLAIGKSITLEEKRLDSAWLMSNMPRSPDIGDLLSQVIGQSCKTGGWDLIGQGLVDLGMALLDQNTIGKVDQKLRAVHNLGARLLLKVVKKQADSASSVLEPLTSRILVRTQPQYTEALRIIVKDTATILMEKPSVVSELVENLQRLSYPSARRTLSGLLPLVRFSRNLRDSLILVLRKALFSRSVHTRQVATTGVMLLLKTFKISTSRSVSQLSQSSGSLSQLAVDVHRGAGTSNEALCTELLGVLKRCLGQQGEVRLTFYQGIMEVVTKNPELCEGVLELVYSHVLSLWGEEGRRERWRLDMAKLGKDGEEGWVLEEPVGWFLHCVQMLVGKAQQVVGDDCEVLDRMVELLDEMAMKYSECDLGDLGYEVTDNFERKTKDGERRMIQVEQLQGILEALMEYEITHGADQIEDKSKVLLNLQKKHTALKSLVSTSLQRKKCKKGEKNDKKDNKEGEGGDKSVTNGKRGKGFTDSTFTPPSHCFSLKSLSLILSSLLTDRLPDHQGALSILRSDPEFSSYLLDTISSKLAQISSSLAMTGDEGPQSDTLFRYLTNITNTMFNHSMVSLEQIHSVVLSTTNCLLQILKLLLSYFPRRKLITLSSMSETNPGTANEEHLNPVLLPVMKIVLQRLCKYNDKLKQEEPEEEEVPANLATIVSIFTLLFKELDHGEGLEKVREWIKRYTEQLDTDDCTILKPSVTLFLQCSIKLKGNPTVGEELAKGLHSLTGDLDTSVQVETVNKYIWLNNSTKEAILPLLLDHLDGVFDSCDLAITWLKALSSTSTHSPTMAKSEASLCMLVARQVNAASELVKTAFPLGQPMDGVLKLLVRLYTVAGSLTKHFTIRTSKQSKAVVNQAKFEILAMRINTELTKHVYNLITWLENKQKERDQQAAANRAAKHKTVDPSVARAKVMREARYIPNLILKIETLEKDLLKLGKRIGQNLCEGNKVSVSRDFRIKFSEEMMEKLREDESEEDSDDSADDSRILGTPASSNSTAMGDRTNQVDPSQEPPSKKAKLNKLGRKKENLSDKSRVN